MTQPLQPMTFTVVTYLLQNEFSPQTESKNLKNVTAEQCSMLELSGAEGNCSLESDFSLFTLPLKHKDLRLGLGSFWDLRSHSKEVSNQTFPLEQILCRCQQDSNGYQGYQWLPMGFSSSTCG